MPALRTPDPPLSDGVVALRPLTEADVPAITVACQDPLTAHFTHRVPAPYAESNAVAFLARLPDVMARGEAIHLAIADAGDDGYLGTISLQDLDWESSAGDVGYLVAPAARGRGVAARATRLLARWAIEDVGLLRVELSADVDNERSRKVAERAGFTYEGIRRSAFTARDRRWDLAVYSLVPADLE